MLKVGVIDYIATGEGRHIYIKTGTEDSIRRNVGDWLYQGADVYSIEEWLEIDSASDSSNQRNSAVVTLKKYAPALWDAMVKGLVMKVDIEYHDNQS
ncbi:hypothetical protein EDB59_0873 [Vibrio crassostreae]|uniref:hypothetical protein n=1 Tax=Vibrio crassostreae TaxID=246167 RepID=UPI000F48C40C|nr:hypothetical protein [Vibrio crassostreae]ROR70224.1 hypothetical protein EDB59_0873 [Vibrio crassostreae]